MALNVPLPDPGKASQFFDIFYVESSAHPTIERVRVDVLRDGKLESTPVLAGGRAKHLEQLPVVTTYIPEALISPGPQLVNRVSPSFSNEVLEHPTQEGFSLDHTYEKLNVFEVEATLYEGRVERLTKLNELRTGKAPLVIICDMDVYKNYIISDINPIMHSGSANAFDVSITFQEIRRVELISPSITTYTDVDEHGNDTKDGGDVTLTLKSQVIPPEEKSNWDKVIFAFKTVVGAALGSPRYA